MALVSCQSLKSDLDLRGLRDYARSIELMMNQDQVRASELDDQKGSEKQGREVFNKATQNDTEPVERQPMTRWKLSLYGKPVLGERLRFAAPEGSSLGDSYFYYFHSQKEGPKKVILWAPGFGVSDFAFLFIRHFFQIELDLGWDVLVWVPPYHLDRQIPGKKAGEGLITPDLHRFQNNMNSVVNELSQGVRWLKREGYERIGAWGGSFGAASLLRLSQQEAFDHLAMMIPLIDWNTVWESVPFAEIRRQFGFRGLESRSLASIFASVSPRSAQPPQVLPERILFLFADYDQLTPLDVSQSYAASLGASGGPGPVVRNFKESHSTILLNRGVYGEYRKFLEQIDRPTLNHY